MILLVSKHRYDMTNIQGDLVIGLVTWLKNKDFVLENTVINFKINEIKVKDLSFNIKAVLEFYLSLDY